MGLLVAGVAATLLLISAVKSLRYGNFILTATVCRKSVGNFIGVGRKDSKFVVGSFSSCP